MTPTDAEVFPCLVSGVVQLLMKNVYGLFLWVETTHPRNHDCDSQRISVNNIHGIATGLRSMNFRTTLPIVSQFCYSSDRRDETGICLEKQEP